MLAASPLVEWRSQLTPDELAHSVRIETMLRHAVHTEGPLSFARFMALVLYAPGLGYYSAGARKFGAGGDFVTAPEITPLFGQTLARPVGQVLRDLGGGDVLELGGGTGALAGALLPQLVADGAPIRTYYLLEVSADLRARQYACLAERCPALLDRVVWLDAWPAPFDGMVVANELLDAMPVERFVWREAAIRALHVDASEHGWQWVEREASPALDAAVKALYRATGQTWLNPYCSEINLALPSWFAALGTCLRRGCAIFIDYGYAASEYYAAERDQGTLYCYWRHRGHADPLVLPGLQDITAHVDFSAVADAAFQHGFEVMGYTSQAHFLLDCGLHERLAALESRSGSAYYEGVRQFKMLTLPGEMGERFKVMALRKDWMGEMAGFGLRDFSGVL
jgi:SAM-dependent MidA family methyltransferase